MNPAQKLRALRRDFMAAHEAVTWKADLAAPALNSGAEQPTAGRLERRPATPRGVPHLDRVGRGHGVTPDLSLLSRDPAVGFGRVCLRGTGISTLTIYNRSCAGETPTALAEDYGVPLAAVQAAIAFQEHRATLPRKARERLDEQVTA